MVLIKAGSNEDTRIDESLAVTNFHNVFPLIIISIGSNNTE